MLVRRTHLEGIGLLIFIKVHAEGFRGDMSCWTTRKLGTIHSGQRFFGEQPIRAPRGVYVVSSHRRLLRWAILVPVFVIGYRLRCLQLFGFCVLKDSPVEQNAHILPSLKRLIHHPLSDEILLRGRRTT